MTRPPTILFAVCVIAGLCSAPFSQANDASTDPPPLPARFLPDRIARLETEIANRNAMIAAAESSERTMLQAERNLLLIARRLLKIGEQSGEDGSAAVMYGLTIAHHAEQLPRAIEPLPKMVLGALRADPPEPEQVARLAKIVDALRQFNRRCGRDLDSLDRADAASVDRYLQHLLSPLAIVIAGLNQPQPADTWVNPDGVTGTAGGPVTPAHFDRLARRFAAAPLPPETRAELDRMIDLCRRGWHEADLTPLVVDFHDQLVGVADVVETFAQATWLDKAAFDRFQRQVHTAVMLLKDPRTRDAAIGRLDRLARVQRLMQQINELAHLGDEAPVKPLREMFILAHDLYSRPDEQRAADRLVGLLERIAAAATTCRRMNRQVLPADLQHPFRITARQYEQIEVEIFSRLPILTDNPADVARPQWSNLVDRLERQVRRLEQLNAIPEWVTRMSAFNPVAGRGLYGRLRRIGEDLIEPQTEAGAAATLDELQKQLALFERLPQEQQLNQPDAPIRRFTGDHHDALFRQITVLRSQWAAAWGAGADPTEPGRRLLQVRRLLAAMGHAVELMQTTAGLSQLNRWAAWEIDAGAIDPLKAWGPARLQLACELAGAGQWAQLETTLEQIDETGAVGRLVSYLSQRLGEKLGDVPGGLSGMLGQCLYPPSAGAMGRDRRDTLAQLSVYLTAAEFARANEQPAAAQQLMSHCGRLARQLLKHWQGAAPQLIPPPDDHPPPTTPEVLDV